MRDGGSIFARIQLVGKCIEGQWIGPEVRNIKDCFSIWEIETGQIRI